MSRERRAPARPGRVVGVASVSPVEPDDAPKRHEGQAGGAEQALQVQAADEGDVTGDLAVVLGDPGGHHAPGGDPGGGVVRPAGRIAAGLVHPAQAGHAGREVRGLPGPDWHAAILPTGHLRTFASAAGGGATTADSVTGSGASAALAPSSAAPRMPTRPREWSPWAT